MVNGHRLIDALPFRNELDLLELRLRELDALVDQWLVVQGEETHAGRPKPIVFDPDDARWSAWQARLTSLVVPRMPQAESRWEREHAPRHLMTATLMSDAYAADDLVIISDADEIPDGHAIEQMAPLVTDDTWVGFRPHLYQYYLNVRAPQWWSGIALASVATVRRIGVQAIRDQRKHPPILTPRGMGGWHFSYLGGVEAIRDKLAAYAHWEYDKPEFRDPEKLARQIALLRHPLAKRGGHGWQVPLRELPREVQAHPERYRHLCKPVEMAQ